VFLFGLGRKVREEETEKNMLKRRGGTRGLQCCLIPLWQSCSTRGPSSGRTLRGGWGRAHVWMGGRQQASICVFLCSGAWEGGGAGGSAVLCSAVEQADLSLCVSSLLFLCWAGLALSAWALLAVGNLREAKQAAAMATVENDRQAADRCTRRPLDDIAFEGLKRKPTITFPRLIKKYKLFSQDFWRYERVFYF